MRAGKSLIAAMALLHSILTCQFRRLPMEAELPDADGLVGVRPGELVRALIVAPLLKLSRAPFEHLVGTMQASRVLAPMLVKAGSESCVIRRPDGRLVTVELVAASSGGANLRSTWLAGVIFDEADFHDDEEGAVNLPENFRAAITRMLAGAQIWVPSSPWSDSGPFHEMFTAAFGDPGRTLAFHSDSRSMNPTLSREDEEAERKRDPENAAREYDAIPFSSNTKMFFTAEALALAVNKSRPLFLLPERKVPHYGGSDLGQVFEATLHLSMRYRVQRPAPSVRWHVALPAADPPLSLRGRRFRPAHLPPMHLSPTPSSRPARARRRRAASAQSRQSMA